MYHPYLSESRMLCPQIIPEIQLAYVKENAAAQLLATLRREESLYYQEILV